MKKIIALFISLFMSMTMPFNIFATEDVKNIDGLYNCLNKICLNSNLNTKIRENMQVINEEYLQDRVNAVMEYPDYVKEKMGLKLGNDEYVEKQIRDGYGLNMDKGLLISKINTIKYLSQYSNKGCFSYLFNENGKIEDGHAQLINHIKSIENDAERKNQIDYSLSQNLINQTEANELY